MDLLTSSEIARKFGVTARAVRHVLTAYWFPRRLYFDAQEAQTHLEAMKKWDRENPPTPRQYDCCTVYCEKWTGTLDRAARHIERIGPCRVIHHKQWFILHTAAGVIKLHRKTHGLKIMDAVGNYIIYNP